MSEAEEQTGIQMAPLAQQGPATNDPGASSPQTILPLNIDPHSMEKVKTIIDWALFTSNTQSLLQAIMDWLKEVIRKNCIFHIKIRHYMDSFDFRK